MPPQISLPITSETMLGLGLPAVSGLLGSLDGRARGNTAEGFGRGLIGGVGAAAGAIPSMWAGRALGAAVGNHFGNEALGRDAGGRIGAVLGTIAGGMVTDEMLGPQDDQDNVEFVEHDIDSPKVRAFYARLKPGDLPDDVYQYMTDYYAKHPTPTARNKTAQVRAGW